MSKINDGGPAFPNVPDGAGDKWSDWDHGMTLRDYFAAMAMQEIMAFKFNQPIEDGMTRLSCAESYAKNAYIMADAMLAAREKGCAE